MTAQQIIEEIRPLGSEKARQYRKEAMIALMPFERA